MFRIAASGTGRIPWQPDYERMEEDWANRLRGSAPSTRRISLHDARVAARQMRTELERLELRLQDDRRHRQCPLDLNALIPVPDKVLSLGPGDPVVLAWLWENWGTTWVLRGVEEVLNDDNSTPLPDGREVTKIRFFSADWTPWRALATIRERWPDLNFTIKPLAATE